MKTDNKKKNLSLLLCIGVAIVLVLNVYLLFSYQGSGRLSRRRGLDADSISEFDIKSYTKYLMMSLDLLQNDGIKLECGEITDVVSHNKMNADSLFADGTNHLLVCRISYYDCEACDNYALERAIEFMTNTEVGFRMAVFGNYETDLALKIYGNNHSNCDDLMYYRVEDLNIPIDSHGNPYYFVINKDMIVSDVYSPEKMLPEQTGMYFEVIKNKWN